MRRFLLLLALSAPLAAQTPYGLMNFQLQTAQGQAVSGATINVYTQSACGASAGAAATLYPTANGGTPLTQPLYTNGFGMQTAYAAQGCYTVVYNSPYTGTQTFPDQNVLAASSITPTPTPYQLTQDVTAGPGTGSQPATVVGILTHSLPSLSAGYLQWTGSAWAFGSGGVGGSGTIGYVPQWTGSTTLGNSFIDYGVTNSGAYTISKPVIIPSTAQVGLTATTLSVYPPTGASANFAAQFFGPVLINSPASVHALSVKCNSGDGTCINVEGGNLGTLINLTGTNTAGIDFNGSSDSQGSITSFRNALAVTPRYGIEYTAGGGSGGDPAHLFVSSSSASADSGGYNYGVQLQRGYTQSATASGIDLMIRRAETSVGSGPQNFIDAAVGTSSTAPSFWVDHTGDTHINDGSGHGGAVDMSEGTAPSAASGHDIIYADTSHCIKVSLNGGSFTCLSTSTGTVTSVGLTMPSWFAVGSSPITSSGTIGVTAATGQTSHQVIGTCGSATSFGPCSLGAGDLPSIPLSGLAAQAADTIVQNATGGSAAPTAVAMPTCTSGADLYNTSTHSWSCVSTGATVVPTVVDTSTPVSVSSTNPAEFHFNENATAATAVTYNLPTAAAGKQFCFTNAYNGSAANTGVLTIATSATGQFIIFTDGTLTATGGNVTSGGAAADGACVVGVDSTHWMLYVQVGTWTKH